MDLLAKLNSFWGIKNGFKLTPIGKGFFCIRFKNFEDQNQAWLHGLTNLKPGSFKLQPWQKDFKPELQHHTSTLLWIRLHGVAQEYWDPQLLISIASLVGIPHAIDPNTKEFTYGHFARIQVEVDLLNPLHPKLLIEREGFSFEVLVTYENIPKFCMHCHLIGHLVGECRSLKKVQEEAARVQFAGPKPPQKKQHISSNNNVKENAHTPSHQKCISTTATVPTTVANPTLPASSGFAPIHIATSHTTASPQGPAPSTTPTLINVVAQHNHSPQAHRTVDTSHSSSEISVVPCSLSSKNHSKSVNHKQLHHSCSFYKQTTPTPSTNRSLSSSHNAFQTKNRFHNQFEPLNDLTLEGDGDGENWNLFGCSDDDLDNSSSHHEGDYHIAVPTLNTKEALDWDTMAEDDPLPSWEARADAEFAFAMAKIDENNGCIQLEQDDRATALEHDFPPFHKNHLPSSTSLSPAGSPCIPINAISISSNEASHSATATKSSSSEYVPSPIKTRAQRQKNAKSLSLTKQQKLKKAVNRENKALYKLSKSKFTSPTPITDPDEVQWHICLKDIKKRMEDAKAAAATSTADRKASISAEIK